MPEKGGERGGGGGQGVFQKEKEDTTERKQVFQRRNREQGPRFGARTGAFEDQRFPHSAQRRCPRGGKEEKGEREEEERRRSISEREGGYYGEEESMQRRTCRAGAWPHVHTFTEGRYRALKTRPSHPTITKTQVKKRKGLFKTQKIIHWPPMRCGPVRHDAARCGAVPVCACVCVWARVCMRA